MIKIHNQLSGYYVKNYSRDGARTKKDEAGTRPVKREAREDVCMCCVLCVVFSLAAIANLLHRRKQA
jgi:hypothetical protein